MNHKLVFIFLSLIVGAIGYANTFVYNRDGKLLTSFQGETKAEVLYELNQGVEHG